MVGPLVCASDDNRNSNLERIANPQERRHCNRAAGLDLLPMASGESKGNHIFLAEAVPLAQFLYPLPQCFEESRVVYHATTFTVPNLKHHEQISAFCLPW